MHKAKTAAEENSSDSDTDNIEVFTPSVSSVDPHQMGKWLVDCGASSHMTKEKALLSEYQEFKTPEKVGLGGDRTVDAIGVGNVHVKMKLKVGEPKKCVIYRVLYVPKLACNLFSVRAAVSKGNSVKFSKSKCWIQNPSGDLYGTGLLVGKLYQLDCEPISAEHASVALKKQSDLDLWHQRLGHLNAQHLKEAV